MAQDKLKAELIKELLAFAKKKVSGPMYAQVLPFLGQYYEQLDIEDLKEAQISDLYGAAMSHWQLCRTRSAGTPNVRVYNPRLDEHAWQSGHTVAEIVNDDMPFLVDSVSMEVNRNGLTLHLIVHPQMRVKRDAQGQLVAVLPRDVQEPGSQLESLIHVEMDRYTDPARLKALEASLRQILGDVRCAVADWQAMRERIQAAAEGLARAPHPKQEIDESQAFLAWLMDGRFTMLGYRDYDLAADAGADRLRPAPGSGLGLLREGAGDREPAELVKPTEVFPQADMVSPRDPLVFLTKANRRATVHRPGFMDYIGIKRYGADGKLAGELRLVGLYASKVFSASPFDVPMLRLKVANVVQRAGLLPESHLQKNLISILEAYPREEILEISEQELFDSATGILRLQGRQRTRLFARRDPFGRYVSCLVFVPRDKFNTELRLRVQRLLVEAYKGTHCDFSPHLTESVLARIQFLIRTDPSRPAEVDERELEARIIQATHLWEDDLAAALVEHFGEERGVRLRDTLGRAFPAGYREEYTPQTAVFDTEMLAGLSAAQPLGMNLYRPVEAEPGTLRFKLYHFGAPVTLSESLPMLEHLGVKVQEERPYPLEPEGGAPLWVHDIGLKADDPNLDVDAVKPLFQELFSRAWAGEVENDDFNRLVVQAQLNWRQIVILRAYAKYFKQIGLPYSQQYIEQTLAAYPKLARKLAMLFAARFDPALKGDRNTAISALATEIRAGLDEVANLDQDRILRQYLDTLLATLRTNYYQNDAQGRSKPYVSFKFNPAQVPNLPEPRPMFEIFVYSPRVEGVHLRGGKVARGGLRWSDRREDFRTEVLGLVKAQMVKNTVIVPVGSKGGFVLKAAPPAGDRDALLKEGIACYKTFLRGLLDLTDNLKAGAVVPPTDVVRHDPDDPYLVVAADKGTATFSDIANSVSEEYGFWLGDAFASGGGNGYDHKKMAITARGAWESVKRHFRELGHDTQSQDFTVVGVGDMSGDVFGNGMLLSRHIRLLAAFDHRHIFLDPDPDAAQSYTERERVFKLPRSSWADYDAALISPGGGVFPLSVKSIPLSPQVKLALGIDPGVAAMTPNELKCAILKAPVDMLYNGGIGTYVKASFETHAQVGDRANDAIRIDGRDLHAKVVAEGGNLGFTQNGRIEAAQHGVKLYTDAIDNSAGVDCSDHEVNIKILLDGLVVAGDMTVKQRNTVLAEMTDEVGRLVLNDNYYQTQCLSLAARRGVQLLEGQGRLIRALEAAGRLNRRIEFLPDDETLAERKAAKQSLTAPENAVLLAYSKMKLYDDLLAGDVPDDPFFLPTLVSYFPRQVQERHAKAMPAHALKREIVATCITNAVINRTGATFVHRMEEEAGASPSEVIRAYTLAHEVFELEPLCLQIEALGTPVLEAVQGQMLIDIKRFVQKATLWFLRHRRPGAGLAETIQSFKPGIAALRGALGHLLDGEDRRRWREAADSLMAQAVAAELAEAVAGLEFALHGLDLVDISRLNGADIETAGSVYFTLDSRLNNGWLRRQIASLPTETHWQTLARASLRDDLAGRQRAITAAVLKAAQPDDTVDTMIARWEEANAAAVARVRRVINDLQAAGHSDLAMLQVALRGVSLVEAGR